MIDFEENVSLKKYTSLKIGGNAQYFYAPTNIEELKTAIVLSKMKNLNVTILGGGTNVLISDDGIRGLVICMRKFTGIESYKDGGRVHFEVKAGTLKIHLLREFLKHKLVPAEFLSGLPGDVAGGVVMNAGISEQTVKPREFCEIVDWVEVLRNGQVVQVAKEDLHFAYRKSSGWQPGIIVKVGFSWPDEPDEQVLNRVRAFNKSRNNKQPLEYPSAGSVFVNPPGYKSGRLIEECGLKGFQIGDAKISEKHANFIINVGDAKAIHVLEIIKHVQDTVLEAKGVALHTEWILLGF